MTDSDPDVRWMTYAEAAKVLGVNPESVAKRMRRGNWARRPGNDGKPRVAVPVSVLPTTLVVPVGVPVSVPPSSLAVPDSVPDNDNPHKPLAQSVPDKALADVVAAFQEEQGRAAEREQHLRSKLARIQQAVDEARTLADQRAEELAALAERAGRAEGEMDGLKTAAEHMHEELSLMRREVAEAHNRAVTAEQQVIEANRQREGAELALAKIRKWSFLNFLFGREGKGRQP